METEKKLDGDKAEANKNNSSSLNPNDGGLLKGEAKQNEPSHSPNLTSTNAPEEGKLPAPSTHLEVKGGQRRDQTDEREDFDYEECNKNWQEYRVTGKAPTRRGYHASFVHDNKLYVHGGHDIREGTLFSLYSIHLDPKDNENEWEKL